MADSYFVWWLRDFDTGGSVCFDAEHLAMHAAEKIVGNRAAGVSGQCLFCGPGDGTTRVMIERITRADAIKLDLV